MKTLLAIITLGLLAACASKPDPRFRDPTRAEWEAAEFGEEPAAYEGAIRSYLENILRDPRESTLAVKAGPKRTWVGFAPGFEYGYGVCVEVTERGVYTAGVSFGPTFFLLFDSKVKQMREGSDGERLCARLGREPEDES